MMVMNTNQDCIFPLAQYIYHVDAISLQDGVSSKVKCTHQTGDEFNPEFVTTHQHKMISQALVCSKENLDVKSRVV